METSGVFSCYGLARLRVRRVGVRIATSATFSAGQASTSGHAERYPWFDHENH